MVDKEGFVKHGRIGDAAVLRYLMARDANERQRCEYSARHNRR